jgi:hypothetical protein
VLLAGRGCELSVRGQICLSLLEQVVKSFFLERGAECLNIRTRQFNKSYFYPSFL